MTRSEIIAALRDIRVWIWPLMLAVAWWLDREWRPIYFLWRHDSGVLIGGSTAAALILPGALTLAAVIGAVRAWSGRSAANGAYFLVCLLAALVYGSMTLSLVSHRLRADNTRVTVRMYVVYARSLERAQLAGIEERRVVRGSINRVFPVLVAKDGTKIHLRGPGAWEFTEALAEFWNIPVTPEKEVSAR